MEILIWRLCVPCLLEILTKKYLGASKVFSNRVYEAPKMCI